MRQLTIAAVTIAIVASSLLIEQPARAYQSYIHGFSKGDYWPSVQNVSGVYLQRTDVDVALVKQWNTCTTPYSGWPVFQPAWVTIVSATDDWVEIGTGHQCNGFRYWYWGWGWQGGWKPISYVPQPNPDITVYPHIYRVAETWHWVIGGVERASMAWNAIGNSAQAGVESYDDHAYIPPTRYEQLQLTRSEGPWEYWGSVTRVQTPGLCWSDSSPGPAFYAWQDTSC